MNQSVDANFSQRVQQMVAHIPSGRVMTYGDIAAICGSPRAARIVGGVAHQARCANLPSCVASTQAADLTAFRGNFASVDSLHRSLSTARSATQQELPRQAIRNAPDICPMHDLPWHRVVKKDGSLAEGYPGGIAAHEKHLRAEGVVFLPNGHVNMLEAQWHPALEGGR